MKPELKEKLKQNAKDMGLNMAEDSVKKALEFFFMAMPEIAKETENVIDDAVVQFLPLAKPMLMELIDKIDGQEG